MQTRNKRIQMENRREMSKKKRGERNRLEKIKEINDRHYKRNAGNKLPKTERQENQKR